MKSTFLGLGAAALLIQMGALVANACQYCWNAEGPDQAAMAMRMHGQGAVPMGSGAFPLDGAISQFQPSASAGLTAPPAAGTVVTDASGLRPQTTLPLPASSTVPVAISAPAPVVSRAPAAAPAAQPVATAPAASKAAPAPASTHWADAGLMGLAAAGGLFWLRTRRSPGLVH